MERSIMRNFFLKAFPYCFPLSIIFLLHRYQTVGLKSTQLAIWTYSNFYLYSNL